MEKVVAYKTVDGMIHPSKEEAIHAQFKLDFRALYNAEAHRSAPTETLKAPKP